MEKLPRVAVITALPEPLAVTFPYLSTAATAEFDDFHEASYSKTGVLVFALSHFTFAHISYDTVPPTERLLPPEMHFSEGLLRFESLT